MRNEIMKDFIYISLEASQQADKPFEGLMPGTFTDMFGQRVTFTEDKIAAAAARTKMALAARRASEGDAFAGLPIEGAGHFTNDAVGWIVDIDFDVATGKALMIPKWNEDGKRILETNQRRYFSPALSAIDDGTGDFLIFTGGTLTNYPAIRDENDLPAMQPVALEDGRTMTYEKDVAGGMRHWFNKALEMLPDLKTQETEADPAHDQSLEGEDNMKVNIQTMLESINPEQKAELITGLLLEAEDGKLGELISEQVETALENLDANVTTTVEKRVQDELQRRETVAFSERMVTGAEVGFGLPVEQDDLSEFMLSLNSEQREMAQTLFSKIQSTGRVDFNEHGSRKSNSSGRKELSPDMISVLEKTIERGVSLEAFFEANAEDLGAMEQYDLSSWQPADEE